MPPKRPSTTPPTLRDRRIHMADRVDAGGGFIAVERR